MSSDSQTLGLFNRRISTLMICGLNNIWMTVIGNDEFSMSNVLGFLEEDLLNILKVLGLISINGRLSKENTWKKLFPYIYFNKYKQKHWCRFAVTIDSSTSTPTDMENLIILQKFVALKRINKQDRIERLDFAVTAEINAFFESHNISLSIFNTAPTPRLSASAQNSINKQNADAIQTDEEYQLRRSEQQTPLIEQMHNRDGSEIGEVQQEILRLAINKGTYQLEYISPNGKSIIFTRFPNVSKSKSFLKMWINFKRIFAVGSFKQFLVKHFGSIDMSFEFLLKMMSAISRPTLGEKLAREGYTDKYQRYSVEDAVSLMVFGGLNGRQMMRIGHMQMHLDKSKHSRFPYRKLLSQFTNPDASKFCHRRKTIKIFSKNSNGVISKTDFLNKSVRYSYKKTIEVLYSHLKMLRDKHETWLGIDIDGLGDKVEVNFMGDHGGNSMKVTVVLLAYEKCKTMHSVILSIGLFKDSYQIFKEAMIPEMNSDALVLMNMFIVVAEWEVCNETSTTVTKHFDFKFVDKALLGDKRKEQKSILDVSNNINAVQTLTKRVFSENTNRKKAQKVIDVAADKLQVLLQLDVLLRRLLVQLPPGRIDV